MRRAVSSVILAGIITLSFLTSCGTSEDIPHESEITPSESSEEIPAESAEAGPDETFFGEAEPAEAESAETELAESEPVPTEDEITDAAIATILAGMTAEEKLGQMFICAYEDGLSPNETAGLGFSGYLFFQYDFSGETPESFSSALEKLQSESEFGLLFAVDEEGGSVVRASKYPEFRESPFQSPRDIYASSGTDGLYADALDKGHHLASLGLNFNLAPVADIAKDPSSFIYDRSIGISGSGLSEALLAITKGHRESGIASCVKHFPGYGSAEDTHKVMAADHRPIEEIEAYDLVPFYALCEDGVEAVMVSHIFADAIDSTRPASVSSKTVEYIRNTMNYDGIIMTDDLAMAGITEFCSTGNAALEAVLAGYDLLCCTNWESQYPAVLDAVRNGSVTEERLDESAGRILKLKLKLGLWNLSDYTE